MVMEVVGKAVEMGAGRREVVMVAVARVVATGRRQWWQTWRWWHGGRWW